LIQPIGFTDSNHPIATIRSQFPADQTPLHLSWMVYVATIIQRFPFSDALCENPNGFN
jgi:hypothetical protein